MDPEEQMEQLRQFQALFSQQPVPVYAGAKQLDADRSFNDAVDILGKCSKKKP